jgi:hypothetical protein
MAEGFAVAGHDARPSTPLFLSVVLIGDATELCGPRWLLGHGSGRQLGRAGVHGRRNPADGLLELPVAGRAELGEATGDDGSGGGVWVA